MHAILLASLLFLIAMQAFANDATINRNPTEITAAVTDTPVVIDMQHADPLTWHTAPGPVEVNVQPRNDGPSCVMWSITPQSCTPSSWRRVEVMLFGEPEANSLSPDGSENREPSVEDVVEPAQIEIASSTRSSDPLVRR
jgi:hypothetical protein